MLIETALVVLIPEAEGLLEVFRQRFGSSDVISVPAHVTILYPFKTPDEITSGDITTLRELFMKVSSFSVSFRRFQCFTDTLFLMPEPSEPLRQLTETIANVFPDVPPYGGAFKKIIPHLTVIQTSDLQKLDAIAADFHKVAKDLLPIHARINAVFLMENPSSDWRVKEQFSLRQYKQTG
jgi:2'-5' RNA ligase